MVGRTGWLTEERRLTGLPLEVLDPRGIEKKSRVRDAVRLLDRAGRASWPTLFAYQYIAVLRQDPAWGPVEGVGSGGDPTSS